MQISGLADVTSVMIFSHLTRGALLNPDLLIYEMRKSGEHPCLSQPGCDSGHTRGARSSGAVLMVSARAGQLLNPAKLLGSSALSVAIP